MNLPEIITEPFYIICSGARTLSLVVAKLEQQGYTYDREQSPMLVVVIRPNKTFSFTQGVPGVTLAKNRMIGADFLQ